MTRWVGRWIMLVGVIHCVFGAVVFFDPLAGIIRDGIWNAVNGYVGRPLAFWFMLFGLMSILFGASVDQIEKDQQEFSSFLRYGFPILTLLAVVAMPVSGGWLLIPGAAGLLLRKVNTTNQIDP
ncbi:MAG: DUF6463 family protein [Woeseiaceae bacterium]|nr:DUF6463 family protein [Woeseiaceae bacterium]